MPPPDRKTRVHLCRDGQQFGPYSIEQLDEMLQREEINGDDLFWYVGCDEWLPLSQFPGFVPPPGQ